MPKTSRMSRILEWRPRGAFSRTLIVLLLVMPLIVAVAYMWSMWDPRHYLRDVKLAVVNNDQGATQAGKQEKFGQQVVDGLLETDYLNFVEVSASEAEQGLAKGTYLFTVEIPETFSQDVITVIDDKPKQPVIEISYNDYNGTNAPLLTNGLVSEIQKGVAEGIQEGYAKQILDGMNQLGAGLGEAADGAKQLDDGATRLHDGTTQGVDGARQLKDGTTQLRDGSQQLVTGQAQALDGSNQLVAGQAQALDGSNKLVAGQGQLLDGTKQLGDGMVQIDDGVGQLTGTLIPLMDQLQSAVTSLQPVLDTMRAVGLGAQADQIAGTLGKFNNNNPENMASQLRKLKAGTAEVRSNLTDPSSPYMSGLLQLNDGQQQLNNGLLQLNDGQQQLHSGLVQLNDGQKQLGDGIVKVDDGMGLLYDGTLQLNDGTRQLKDGTVQLSTGLTEGSKQAPKINEVPLSSHQIAVPVLYDSQNKHAVQTQVDVHDPTNLTLSGGVSMILILVFGFLLMAFASILLPDVLGRMRKNSAALPAAKAFLLVTAVNMVILLILAGLSATMGWEPAHWGAVLFIFALMAMCGAAVYQFFRTLFGRLVGGIFALGFLGYGAFSFGGVWPLELTPGALRMLHGIHPMSYARYGFIRATDGALDGTFWLGVTGLVLSIVFALALTFLVRAVRTKRAQEPGRHAADTTQRMAAVEA
ncbi:MULTISPECIES: YhgE/Pip domain-containing protein [unclassified Corynebacterium]|uniref:YhgE/Pip domain-containing protein n=1 Tax=unclassified Corynebacterium TaxID=2624378 RepID=UPI0029CA07C8|nr:MULTISPECIES: YhgE/Pip domain-containing protein [unclassified Corynebacterium]WPF66347.1 YhgE/Pip domain-containing protein [Corynebacterium sp. 22KM0430]WPF68837.1 YhgE/Pip domain-containing protein [Corynebacterium sp. 21KM1197]